MESYFYNFLFIFLCDILLFKNNFFNYDSIEKKYIPMYVCVNVLDDSLNLDPKNYIIYTRLYLYNKTIHTLNNK